MDTSTRKENSDAHAVVPLTKTSAMLKNAPQKATQKTFEL